MAYPILNAMLVVMGFIAIILYATWLLIHRLRKGEKASQSFLGWLKHLFEAVMGL